MKVDKFVEQYSEEPKLVMQRFLNREDKFYKFVKIFAENENFANMKAAIGSADFDRIDQESHLLKGLSGNFGFNHMSELFASIMQAARKQDMGTVGESLSEVEPEYAQIIKAIGELEEPTV